MDEIDTRLLPLQVFFGRIPNPTEYFYVITHSSYIYSCDMCDYTVKLVYNQLGC